jgi:hypothetical protein
MVHVQNNLEDQGLLGYDTVVRQVVTSISKACQSLPLQGQADHLLYDSLTIERKTA